MKYSKEIGAYIIKFLKNKYILTLLIFVIWILFLDNNNLVDRIEYLNDYEQLKKDEKYYKEKIEIDYKRLEELRTDKGNLEKYAREQYLMKKKDEDIFLFVEEDSTKK